MKGVEAEVGNGDSQYLLDSLLCSPSLPVKLRIAASLSLFTQATQTGGDVQNAIFCVVHFVSVEISIYDKDIAMVATRTVNNTCHSIIVTIIMIVLNCDYDNNNNNKENKNNRKDNRQTEI